MAGLKRAKVVILITVLVLSLLTSCTMGGFEGNKAGTQTPPETKPASTGGNTAGTQSTTEKEVKPTLRVLSSYQKEDYNTYPVAKVLEERTGYHVEYEMLPSDNPQDKLNLLMASGESYDVINVPGRGVFVTLYNEYARKNALVDLTPLIDQYGVYMKSAISQESFDTVTINGKIYGIPTAGIKFNNASLIIRQDWLDKLNLKMPENIDEFKNVLKTFKEKDPEGKGADKVIPMTMQMMYSIPNLIGAFGMPNAWNDVDGVLTPLVLDPRYKDYLSYVADLYKEGLLDSEFPMNKNSTAIEKFTNGSAGVLTNGWTGIQTIDDALKKINPNAKYAFIPALKGKNGEFGLTMQVGLERISFVPKTSKNPEHAVKWMDANLEPETFRLVAIGEEGIHYTVENGSYLPINPIFTDERNLSNNFFTGVDEKMQPIYWQARVRKDPRLFEAFEFLNITQPPETRIPDVINLAPYIEDYAKYNAQLTSMVSEHSVKVIIGAESLSDYDSFVKKWLDAGGEASFKSVNEWYKTYKK